MVRATQAGKSLVIVESPAKAKTINKYLGSEFVVKASMGHVRDLPQREYGIDLSDNFRPSYEVVKGRTKVVKELKKLADQSDAVFLATDLDREGEAIAWHLVEALSLPPDKVRRVIFNEITPTAIRDAFRQPHEIDLDRVNAQQARRILDRIVGYELSPLLWKKIAKGLSAGRVQSVSVRLIVEREREIRAFVPEESWKFAAFVTGDQDAAGPLRPEWAALLDQEPTQKQIQQWLGRNESFRAELTSIADKPVKPATPEAAREIAESLGFAVREITRTDWEEYAHLKLQQSALAGEVVLERVPELKVADLATKRTTSRAPAPFTTASLQQQASTVLRFSASRTMRVAQSLYEGLDLDGEGPVGLITYMRTDSTNLSGEALGMARGFIEKTYGDAYLPEKPNFYGKRQARTQEAHEAVRPTDPKRTPERIKSALTSEQYKLYELIWKRFVACQMAPAQWDSTSVTLSCDTKLGVAKFSGSGRKLVFDGFMRVAGVSSEDQLLPALETGQSVGVLDVQPKQQWTSPPARYTEASLVKALETEGIGRPSTYAAIIDTIQQRGYVEQEERKFYPTSLGEVVTDKLVKHFPKIMDVKFTSHMEDELDKIEDAHLDWVAVLNEFYDPFRNLLSNAGDEMEPARSQPSDYACPTCGAEMVYRWSKTGRFLACSKYPECKSTMNVNRKGEPLAAERETISCELCSKPMSVRQSRSGVFLGCSGYPDCRHTIPCDENGVPLQEMKADELEKRCEQCDEGTLKVKWRRLNAFLGCDRYPKCKNTEKLPEGVFVRRPPSDPPEEAGVACEKCGRPMVIRTGARGKFIACSGYPRCRTTKPIDKLEELRQKSPATMTLAEAEAQKKGRRTTAVPKGKNGKVDLDALGEPPAGFAWTRTGRPVVEVLPADDEPLTCPECGEPMEMKRGRFGPFFSCTGFPKCKFNANLRGQAKKDAEVKMPAPKPIPTDIPCDECGAPMLIRQGPRGKFMGCSNYPKCKATSEMPPGLNVEAYANAAGIVLVEAK